MSRIKRKHGPGGGIQGADTTKSRKERRKEARTLKKQLKADCYRRLKGGKKAPIPEPETVIVEKPSVKKDNKEKKAKKEADKQRRRRLKEDNAHEEANIKQLSKKLGLNKRKSKNPIPKSFLDDGLDFLLDAVDSEKINNRLLSDDENEADSKLVDESNSDFDETDSEGVEDQEFTEMEEEEEEEEEDLNEEGILEKGEEGEEVSEDDVDLDGEGSGDEEIDLNEDDSDDVDFNEEEDESSDMEEEKIYNEMTENSEVSDKEASPESKKSSKVWEDIYGRKRDVDGNVLSTNSYVPPALRNSTDEGTKIRLKKKMKGLLNRLAESNLHSICTDIESIFSSNSRRDTNAALSELLSDACISHVLAPERLIMEHVLLVSILSANVGTEVGAHFLHHIVTKFDTLYVNTDLSDTESKELDCCLLLISYLYAFKVVDSSLVFDLIRKLTKSFEAKDIELILQILKAVGFNLRKDDPVQLKSVILEIQSASSSSQIKDSRTKFMIEILMAIKNNNVKKIPNYDPELQPHLKKIMKNFLRPGTSTTPLSVRLEDLLKANQKGRWWIVGSAWAGKENSNHERLQPDPAHKEKQFSSQILDLARRMRMNTHSRKMIFCSVMSAVDYLDAFERLLKLKNIPNKEREIAFVLQDCCLQEKEFNPFYFQVMSKLSSTDRKYRMASQYCLWDKIKEIESLSQIQRQNLAEYSSSLILKFSLPLSVLKVVSFADVNKPTIAYLKTVLAKILMSSKEILMKVLSSVTGHTKLKDFRESITIFMTHFMLKSKENPSLHDRIRLAENVLRSKDLRTYF